MPRKTVIGNWKMNLMREQALAWAEQVEAVPVAESVQIGVAPSFTLLPIVAWRLSKSTVRVGGQDVFWESSGAFTGCVSAPMLRDAGSSFCIVGHSETRGRFGKAEVPQSAIPYFAETNETIHLKVRAALAAGLEVVLCVGETLSEREAGSTEAVIQQQLAGALHGISREVLARVTLAYEPVWAIGTGQSCDPSEANRVAEFIRKTAPDDCGPVLYGGSVKPSNAFDLFSQAHIDGGLVGGASLDASEFLQIVRSAEQAAR